jgi:iron(III) transport system ATP-binding protein
VTHDQAEAVVLGDTIGVMRDGKLLQMAPPSEIYNSPADLFVANFTGATNEIVGTLGASNGAFASVKTSCGQALQARLMQPLKNTDARVRIAVRPENVTLGRSSDTNCFTARVLDRRYQGTQTVYDIECLGHKLEVLELGTAARFDVGQEPPVTLAPDACWAYADSGGAHLQE